MITAVVPRSIERPSPRVLRNLGTTQRGENLVTIKPADKVRGKPAMEELSGLRTLVNFQTNICTDITM